MAERWGSVPSAASRIVANAVNVITGQPRNDRDERGRWSYEQLVLRVLRENNGMSLAQVVERVAEAALRAEQQNGAWTTDIAIWGPAVFRREATLVVRQMFGQSIVLEGEGGGPWLAVPLVP